MSAEITTTDEKAITVAVPADSVTLEQFGKFLVNTGQDGYTLKSAPLVTEEKGTQRDPYSVTKGVKVTVARA